MSRQVTAISALILCALPGALWAGEIPETFTLGRYVPDTCRFYKHRVHNPERAYIDQQWARVHRALKQVGMVDEVKNLVTGLLPEEERPRFDEQWSQLLAVCQEVSWGELAQQELVIAGSPTPVPTILILGRGAPGSGERNAAALSRVVDHLASLDEGLQVSRRPAHDCKRSCLVIPGAPFCLDVFWQGDVIGISSCPTLTQRVAELMAGVGDTRPIIESERFAQALAVVPAPEDSLTWLDFRALATDLRGLIGSAYASKDGYPQQASPQEVFLKILNRVDVFDYLLAVQHTEGIQERAHMVVSLQRERAEAPFARTFANRAPLRNPYRFIPKEATNFSVSNGLDWDVFYALILDVLAHDVPDGEAALATWQEIQDKIGFHVQEDFLDWFSGESISVTLPRANPTPFSYTDSAILFRVKDAELAARKMDAGIARLGGIIKQYANMDLLNEPATGVNAPGFRSVTFPPLAIFVRPVVGVHETWLVAGTSVEAVNGCLAVGAGEAPNILASERFRREGILRDEPVSSASFTDLSNLQQQLAGVFATMGMFGGIATKMAREKEGPKTEVVQSLMSMLQRLGPVVAQIDFYSSTATYATFDGLAWKMEALTTYRAPPEEGR
jgi:hypothetical protein